MSPNTSRAFPIPVFIMVMVTCSLRIRDVLAAASVTENNPQPGAIVERPPTEARLIQWKMKSAFGILHAFA